MKRPLLLAGVLILAALAAYLVIASRGDEQKPSATLTVPVDGLDAGKAPDRSVEVPKSVVTSVAPKLEDELRNETPVAAPLALLDNAKAAADKIAQTKPALSVAGATGGFDGCRTSFVQNQSSRRGVRPNMQTLHYTVSPNRPGWSDVDAVVALFNRTSSQASSHFIIDSEGHCAYIVPIEAKAWTQAAGNPFSVSYEIIATGREAVYLAPAGMAKLRKVTREVAKRTGIPMRRGSVSGCAPSTTGIVQHKDWGICGGGHVDVQPFSIDAIVKAVVAGSGCSRACDLRKRNTATHAELKRRSCAPIDETKSDRCVLLHRRHKAIHAAAKRDGVRL